MKKIYLFIMLIACLITAPAGAGVDEFLGQDTVDEFIGQPVAGEGCATPDNGNLLDEGFPSTPNLTWTDTGSTITVGADLPGTGPTGTWQTCDVGARFQADNSAPWKYHNLGATTARTNNISIVLIVYINSASLSGYGTNNIFSFNNSTTPANNQLGRIDFRYTSGTTYDFWSTGDTASNHINVAVGTYYKITLYLDGAHGATGSSLDIDSWNGSAWGDVGNATFQRYDANDAQYVHVGPYSGVGVGETLDMYVGLMSINSVTP
jgi:hypothetical protein